MTFKNRASVRRGYLAYFAHLATINAPICVGEPRRTFMTVFATL